jgi:hypothetical protein
MNDDPDCHFRGEDFLEIIQSETRIVYGGHIGNSCFWLVDTAMFDGSRGHHSWSERELYMHCSFIVW